jgi:hypothetical protein
MAHSPACVADNDAPLIGERAATRGRTAMGSGDEHGIVKRESRAHEPHRARNLDASPMTQHCPRDWMSVRGRTHPSHRRHDARLIDERAATAGKVAMSTAV